MNEERAALIIHAVVGLPMGASSFHRLYKAAHVLTVHFGFVALQTIIEVFGNVR